jgi:methylmalonyl-CoA mutase
MSDSHDPVAEFPPVTTAEWEAQIARDLKGADYEKRLVWKTDEGIPVRPYYRAEHITRRDPTTNVAGAWEMVRPGSEPPLSVDAITHHDNGATAVQEVAWALAEGADRLAAGLPVEVAGFAIGSNHFMEIAKLRAMRRLWTTVASAFGLPAALRIHARTAGENKTIYDACVNMLRVTTEALSAVLGGCDSLTVTPCGFDAHLAENVQHILREESHLDKVADAGAGSYYIEALTGAVAVDAWSLFQSIEAVGGWAVYRASGAVDAALAADRAAKEKAVALRRRVLVGTNNYPNLLEREPGHGLDRPLDAAGAHPGWRLAAPFEAIRMRTERHARATGRTPRVLLLEHGDLRMRKARSGFCLNFFGCAGFEIETSDTLAEADLVVLCSSDAEYLDLARSVVPKATVPVIVAGYPKASIEALTEAGVADFVHAQSNAVETLTKWQDRLGMDR